MAVAAPVRAGIAPDTKVGEMLTVTWTMDTGDTATAVSYAEFADRSVQVEGNDGGGTVTIEGSNDGANYHTLTDAQGNALSLTAPALEQVTESTVWIKPVLTGGAAGSIVVTLFLRRNRR